MKLPWIKSKSALVLWYSVDLNYGDYLIFQTVKEYLEEWGYFIKDMDVGLPYEDIAKEAKKHDLLWFAGGGIIERGIPDIIKNFSRFHKKCQRVKYGVTGLSIGDFDYSDYYESLRYWVKNAAFFYSRDSYTASELNRISESNLVIDGVDVVFGNREIPKLPRKDGGRVGISLRDLPYKDLSGEFKWYDWGKRFKKVLLGPMIGIPDQYDCTKRIDIPFDADYTPEKVTELLQEISYTISMRFHVILVAAILGKVSIPIGYCPKVSRLARQLGLEDLELKVHDYEKLDQSINQYLTHENEYKINIQKNVNTMQQRAVKMFQEVENILKGEK